MRHETSKPERILVVDDDKNMAKTVLDILRIRGYQAHIANTGEEALTLAEERHFKCLLSDIKMPGMSGVDLYHAFQEHHPDTPIIFMTAYASADLLTDSVKKGAVAVLQKPLNFELLFTHLSTLMS